MKRLILLLVLACSAMLTATTAWAVKPIDSIRGPFAFGPFPWFDCTQFDDMDYWLWVEGETMDVGKIFIDQDGVWIKTVGKEYTADALIWMPADPGCNTFPFAECVDPFTIMEGTNTLSPEQNAGTAEHQNVIFRDWILIDPDETPGNGDEFWYPTWGQRSALKVHIGVPGYGNIFSMAGHMTYQFNFSTREWDVITMTPNWDNPKINDVYAACSYVGNR
jgi:hypothetical protein